MKKPVTLIFFLFLLYALAAQPSNASFLHYTTEQGLSNDYITSIVKDQLGFLWVGTSNGLNRFNGRSFKILRHDPDHPESSLPDDAIRYISVAPDGWLWIATQKGLCKLDPISLLVRHIQLPENLDTLENDDVSQVAFDAHGIAWTTGVSGIYRIDPVSGKVELAYRTPEKVQGWFGSFIDEKDRLWMIKDYVSRYDPATGIFKRFAGVDPNNPFDKAATLSVVRDYKGQRWAGGWGRGIWKYDHDLDEFIKHSNPEVSLAVSLLPDTLPSGSPFLWVGGGKSGLGIYYPETRQFVDFKPDTRDPYTHNNYLAVKLFKDPDNDDVWIGTEVGLERYAPATVRFGRAMIPVDQDMGQFSLVSAVVHDQTDPLRQRYFVAVWGAGLFIWNKMTGEFQRVRNKHMQIGEGSYFNLLQDSKGNIWSCLHGAIGRRDPVTGDWKDYHGFFHHNERNNVVWCGVEGENRTMWFGTGKEGLYRYNPASDRMEQAFYDRQYADTLGNLDVHGISKDTRGRLWLACMSSGLIRYDPKTAQAKRFYFPVTKELKQVCTSVVVGRNGNVYASFYNGFLELDSEGNLLRLFSQQNGLKTGRIYFMVEDRLGRIWFNSELLLHCFDPVTGEFSYYGKSDGLFSNIMTDALSITPDGEIFVGFQNAFSYFYPDRLHRNTQPPPVAITSIKVMNRERPIYSSGTIKLGSDPDEQGMRRVEYDSLLILRPGENFFEVEFAALNFNQQERNTYAYFLKGFSEAWVYTDRPVATFTNLDGGDYTLYMKAANNDGIWNEQGATLSIRVVPPFYQTGWFRLLTVFALVLALSAGLWARDLQRRRLDKFRESLARDLHDEMGSTLSSIRFFSEFAGKQVGDEMPQVQPLLQRISQSASNLSESLQDIVWAMKTRSDQPQDLVVRMTDFGLRLLEARQVKFITSVGKNVSGKPLRPDVRRNIYLIFKEAVNNAAKYAEAGEVELMIDIQHGQLTMRICDNGKGFQFRPDMDGNGLSNMRQRAIDIGGTLDINTQSGAGTCVELKVKV